MMYAFAEQVTNFIFDIQDHTIVKLFLAVLCGAVIGIEREYKSKTVGFRTIILITLGSCLFTILSVVLGGKSDPTRIAANIVTGIGFLGAGAIFKEGNAIKGITTAATIWSASAIGMSIGLGEYTVAYISLLLVMIVLIGFTWFQYFIDKRHSTKSYEVVLSRKNNYNIEEFEKNFLTVRCRKYITSYSKRNNQIVLIYTVRAGLFEHHKLVDLLYEDENVVSFESY